MSNPTTTVSGKALVAGPNHHRPSHPHVTPTCARMTHKNRVALVSLAQNLNVSRTSRPRAVILAPPPRERAKGTDADAANVRIDTVDSAESPCIANHRLFHSDMHSRRGWRVSTKTWLCAGLLTRTHSRTAGLPERCRAVPRSGRPAVGWKWLARRPATTQRTSIRGLTHEADV